MLGAEGFHQTCLTWPKARECVLSSKITCVWNECHINRLGANLLDSWTGPNPFLSTCPRVPRSLHIPLDQLNKA